MAKSQKMLPQIGQILAYDKPDLKRGIDDASSPKALFRDERFWLAISRN
jgi:hypothetical protein